MIKNDAWRLMIVRARIFYKYVLPIRTGSIRAAKKRHCSVLKDGLEIAEVVLSFIQVIALALICASMSVFLAVGLPKDL